MERRITFLQKDKSVGCLAMVQVPLPKRTKLGPNTIDYIYLGPTKNSVAYRFLVYKPQAKDVHINTIIEYAEAEFFETSFLIKTRRNLSLSHRKEEMRMSHLKMKHT